MLLARARRVRSPRALPGLQRSSTPQTAAPVAAIDDESPARTTLFPFRSLPAAGKSNLSRPPSESAGSLPGSRHAPPRSAGIRNAWNILRAAADSLLVAPAGAPPVAPAASNAPGPPAFAGNRMRLLSSQLPLLP